MCDHTDIAINLHTRPSLDVSRRALIHLHRIERMGSKHQGGSTLYNELHRIGLVTLGTPHHYTGLRTVGMTQKGRRVSFLLEDLREGRVQPLRCRFCGELSDGIADVCVACSE